MQHTSSTTSAAMAAGMPLDDTSSSNVDEFEAILNQLTALGSEIDQELEHSKRSTTSSASSASAAVADSVNNNSGVVVTDNGTMKMKTGGGVGNEQADFYGHHGHHHFSHYHSQSLDTSPHDHHHHHSPLVTTTATLRTDSPDNDSAFSDSISLISTEQSSSSSSSSSSSGVKPSIAPSSAASVSLNSSLVTNVTATSHNHQQLAPSGPSALSLGPPPNSPLSTTSQSDSSSTIIAGGSSSSTLSSLDVQLMQLNQQQELFFEQLGRTQAQSEPASVPTSSSGSKINGSSSGSSFDKHDDGKDDALYLKVFAQDNSAKSLLADERMTIGAICGQLAAKNHISMDTSLCIIEHMPQLYLERFFEDHESLVENVLHWGRETPNKLYFMQRSDKYDLFHHPEKYLISGEPSSTESTLKSTSTSTSTAAAAGAHLRHDLISQFFSPTSGIVKVPEIDGELYLRAEGKKTWKKYFFTLRSSGLYYCAKGRPKSTKDLICLATFDLNAVYLGFGWKKKFKAPSEFGFAIKHPQVQSKAPKHIKYLCAESEDQLRLWLTGIRIAKYGKQLRLNFEQFQMVTREGATEEKSNHPKTSTSSFPDTSESYHHAPHHPNSSSSSVVMRSNRIARDESARSSSTSSTSSGCMSEGASTGSGTTSVSNPGNHHHHHFGTNGTMSPMGGGHLEGATTHASVTSLHYLGSPTHHYSHYPPQSTISLNTPQPTSGFDTDFPLGTIKRKPSVPMMPKIPLTKNTRNLALQSEDVLLEQNEHDQNGNGGSNYDPNEDIYGAPSGPNGTEGFQRGTFKTGTLRRSTTTDERMKKQQMSISSPMHHLHHQVSQGYLQVAQPPQTSKSDSEDDLPPPPPPLKESESTLSLSASFPPPPPEMLATSPAPSPPGPTTQVQYGSMTPQPQPKNAHNNNARLSRRLSDLSSNSTHFLNYRNNNGSSNLPAAGPEFGTSQFQHQPQHQNQNQPNFMLANSRASIATSGIEQHNSSSSSSGMYSPAAGFVTLKPYHSRGNSMSGNGVPNGFSGSRHHHHHRQLTLDLNSALSKYGTTPRIRNEAFIASLAAASSNGQPNDHFGQQLQLHQQQSANFTANNTLPSNNYAIQNGAQQQHQHHQNQQHQQSGALFIDQPHYHANGTLNDPASVVGSSTAINGSGTYGSSPCANNSYTGSLAGVPGSTSPAVSELQPTFSHAHLPHSSPYGHAQSYYPTGSTTALPPPPPVPTSPGLIQTGAITSRPATSSNENVIYMSISPHLLQKHQQMAKVNNTSGGQSNGQQIYSIPPEQVFIKNMERVMQKKWHVAQMLSRDDDGSTPGEVLGFRDPAYLPPRGAEVNGCSPPQGYIQQNGYPAQMHPQHYHVHHHHHGGYQGPGPMYSPETQQQQQIYGTQPPPLPPPTQRGKSVRIADNPTIFGNPSSPMGLGPTSPPICQSPVLYSSGSQQIYALGGKKVPPPPPKRSESTHLTTNGSSSRR